MTSSYLSAPGYLKIIYNAFGGGRRKEKLDYILEPLQALLQLSLLGFSPVGSKLTIKDNLLYIQQPGISQGIIRFFNDDTKEDLYYLFNVFRRFVMYYKHLYLDDKHRELYELLIELSKSGLNKLIITYTNSDRINVLHTLQMYKVILDKPDFVIPDDPTITEHTSNNTDYKTTDTASNNNYHKSPTTKHKKHNKHNITSYPEFDSGNNYSDESITNTHNNKYLQTSNTEQNNDNIIPKGSIDNIFNKIVEIYSTEELNIIYNTLTILTHKKDEDCQTYIDGLNLILQPTYIKIKQWLNDNIAL